MRWFWKEKRKAGSQESLDKMSIFALRSSDLHIEHFLATKMSMLSLVIFGESVVSFSCWPRIAPTCLTLSGFHAISISPANTPFRNVMSPRRSRHRRHR